MRLKILPLLVVIILAGCGFTGEVIEDYSDIDEKVVIGFCPTMSDLAKNIQKKNNKVSLRNFASTSSAISALNSGSVDVILVGRLAKSYELDAYEKRLRKGFTLVGHEKKFISRSELEDSIVHTAAKKEKVKEYLPIKTKVVYYDSVEEAINYGLEELVLINWNDYTDELDLVIPVVGSDKIEKFRIPVMYSYDKTILKAMEL
ncbi:MAG: hypothetical protein ACQESF_04385 [Nanobdellota archaeon]